MQQEARPSVRLARLSSMCETTVDNFLPTRFASVLMPAPDSLRLNNRAAVVLMEERCFSATDIFLGAMRLIPNVTLMGTQSGGGSGRARDFVLQHSKLTVVLSTMASFQVNGELYDGIGVPPAIVVERTIAGFSRGRDVQMDAALEFLRKRIH